ncbi:MAG: hypothetical protein ABSG46_00890 [Candidatus Binataceae bacterium]
MQNNIYVPWLHFLLVTPSIRAWLSVSRIIAEVVERTANTASKITPQLTKKLPNRFLGAAYCFMTGKSRLNLSSLVFAKWNMRTSWRSYSRYNPIPTATVATINKRLELIQTRLEPMQSLSIEAIGANIADHKRAEQIVAVGLVIGAMVCVALMIVTAFRVLF